MNKNRAAMRESPAPAPALILGIGGLVPFVGLAGMIRFGSEAWHGYSLMALSCYGAVILAFVGALHWAYAVKKAAPQSGAWLQYGFSVAPALLAWVSLLISVRTALQLQAAGLIMCYVFDRGMVRNDLLPIWFMQLRALLTAIGAASLTIASWV